MDFLKKGDTIGVVAPGSPVPKKNIKKGVNVLSNMGFNVKLGKHIFSITGYTAGIAKDRANDINRFFSDSQIKAIIAARGGYNCNQILPFLDYGLIKKNPKIFLGLSDVTAVLNAIVLKSNVITFHGPVLLMIGGGRDGKVFSKYSKENFEKILMNEKKRFINVVNAFDNWIVLNKGKAVGKLFGGNLSSLISIIGTSYEPNWKNAILMWETLEEKLEMIDQMLTHLRLAGIFDKINGMMVGKFVDTKQGRDTEIIKMILEQCRGYDFPIIYGVDFGHTNENLILPIGGEISFNTEEEFLKIIKY